MARMKLTCLRISNGGLVGEKLPERLKILGWGDNPNVKGSTVRVTNRTLQILADNQKEQGFDRVALDYEHNTVEDSPEFKRTQEPRKVAGYGIPEVVPGEGLFLRMMTYTPSGVENAREYIDLSPTVHKDEKTGEVDFIHSAALCRQGAVEDLHFFNVNMKPTKGQDMDEIKTQLAALSQTLTELSAKVAALEKPAPELETLTAKVGELNGAVTGELKTQLAALSQTLTELSAKVAVLEKPAPALETLTAKAAEMDGKLVTMQADFASEMSRRDKEILLDSAHRDGKVITLNVESIGKLSLLDLKDHISKIVPTVPLSARTPRTGFGGESAPSGLSLAIAKNCGIDPEKVK